MSSNTPIVSKIRIRAFRAIDDPETCLKFIDGHRKVLSIYGIENITTNTDIWMQNPAIFVIVVETLDGEKLYGGARIQVADGIHPLPIEEATGKMDSKIYEIVRIATLEGNKLPIPKPATSLEFHKPDNSAAPFWAAILTIS